MASASPYKLRGNALVTLTAEKGVGVWPSNPTALFSQPLAVPFANGVPDSI